MTSGTIEHLHDVWGTGPANVYAVGKAGTILRYDGSSWTRQNASTIDDIWAVWGSGPNDVFVVGANGKVFRSDGTSWSAMTPVTPVTLTGVWGASPTDVWAVGYRGTILHYDGTGWSVATSPTIEDLNDVWGSAPGDVWAVGTQETILHWDGTSWTVDRGPTIGGSTYTTVFGRSAASVLVAGSGADLLARDTSASAWTVLSHDASGNGPSLAGIWHASVDTVYAAAEFDGLFSWNGSAWTAVPNTPRQSLAAVWGSSARDVFAVGEGGLVLHGTP